MNTGFLNFILDVLAAKDVQKWGLLYVQYSNKHSKKIAKTIHISSTGPNNYVEKIL